jgi:hypothetical protein
MMQITPAVSTAMSPRATMPASPATVTPTSPTATPAAPGGPMPTATIDPLNPVVPEPARRAHGMLRNLAAGHFSGVAGLRLRLNFADEIKAAGLTLPDPPSPTGNGKGYAKALAAYMSSQPQPPAAAETVDQAA